MEFHFIEMPKLLRDWKEDKLNPWDDVLARWLLLLGIVDRRDGKVYDDIFKELEEIAMKDETLLTAFQSWETLSSNQEEVLAYEARLKHVLDKEAAIREAELREKEARREGLQKGHKEGHKKGHKEGLEEGLKEGHKEGKKDGVQEIVKHMLKQGRDVETVANLTGLTKDEVWEIEQDKD
jgi:predicted transposase/invertase (TIGR01784 family)